MQIFNEEFEPYIIDSYIEADREEVTRYFGPVLQRRTLESKIIHQPVTGNKCNREYYQEGHDIRRNNNKPQIDILLAEYYIIKE